MAPPAPDALAQNRVEGRAQRQRQAAVEAEEGQRQRHDGVDRPRMQAPVKDRRGKAHLAGRLDIRLDDRAVLGEGRGHAQRLRDGHVIDRLEHAEEHQADAHAGGEQHREPAGIAVIRRRVLPAQPDPAHRREQQHQAEDDKDVRGAEEEPVEGRGQRRAKPAEELGGRILEHQRCKDEQDGGKSRDQEDRVVDVQAEWLDVILSDLEIRINRMRCLRYRIDCFI